MCIIARRRPVWANMINEEQRELSDYIKSVHLSLRCKSRKLGADVAWREHIENEEVLRNYSVRMKDLAEKYWSINNKASDDKCLCRIQWIVNAIKEYFEQGGLTNEISKENKKLNILILKSLIDKYETKQLLNFSVTDFKEPYNVLDVGSCYDPFGSYGIFNTFPIDLCPAVPSVKRCDFTQLGTEDIEPENKASWFRDNLRVLPRNFFDAVIFSLFLEYLPSPSQRYLSCQKAYDVLKVNGLLLIVTPDSKHETANAAIMKSWKKSLATIGFVRIKLEKLKYVYCMAYRKSAVRKYPLLLYNIKDPKQENLIAIPQDSVDYTRTEMSTVGCTINKKSVREDFQELPFAEFAVDA